MAKLVTKFENRKKYFFNTKSFFQIEEKKILQKVTFTHPYFDQDALKNQKALKEIQNKRNVLFCGSYFGYGFHEDGIKSSINMIENLND